MVNLFKSFVAVLVLFVSCSIPADEQLALLEKKGFENILEDSLKLAYAIQSTGAFEVDLKGDLILHGNSISKLSASGHFGHIPQEMSWFSQKDSLWIATNQKKKAVQNSDSLTKSIWIGMYRMGLLHNLAMLTTLQPPDQYKGDVSSWVRYDSVKINKDGSYSFQIFVQNQHSGEATVWINKEYYFPEKREQIVRFPNGEMRVKEHFELIK